MIHQNSGRKLNVTPKHRKALLRNQAIHFIINGKLKTTVAQIREVKRLVEKVVTVARKGNHFNNRRKAYSLLPYNNTALDKLFFEIAPLYKDRPGGYTRMIRLHNRIADTAEVGILLWVKASLNNDLNNNNNNILNSNAKELKTSI